MRVRIFLRQSLFSIAPHTPSSGAASAEAGHVPPNAAILIGQLGDQTGFGVTVKVDGYADERGRTLTGTPRTLIVPSAKIDHVWVEEE